MKSKIIPLALIAGFVFSGAAFMGCRGPHFRKSPEEKAEKIVKKIKSELDLNENQYDVLLRIKDEALEKFQEHRSERKETHGKVISLIRSGGEEHGEQELGDAHGTRVLYLKE